MTVLLGPTRIESDCCAVRAIFVGDNQWVLPGFLPGRTLTEVAALGLVRFADAVTAAGVQVGGDDPLWIAASRWLAPVGLSITETVILLDLPHDPSTLPQFGRWGQVDVPMRRPSLARSVLGALTGKSV